MTEPLDRARLPNAIDLSRWQDKVIHPRFDDSGRMFDHNNEPVNFEPGGWGDFLMDKDGEFTTGKCWHGILYELQEARKPGGSTAFGVWQVKDGWLSRATPLSATFLKQSSDPRFAAQLRYQLSRNGVDLTKVVFDGETQGLMWKGEAPRLTVERMRNEAEQIFKGYGDDFWVSITHVSRGADRVDIGLSLNPVRGESGQVTVCVQRVGELTTVQFVDFDSAVQTTRTSAALGALREKMTAWIAESGASWA
ncbi:hypothetical protein [Nocardia brasiliensis]|uniref:hypothetical protein n=1 Tax=Nocardia brasiliensis TaxID=37326 RepID=UPI002458146B|nr:hypothetical protein [Nocardia brasiliensis]